LTPRFAASTRAFAIGALVKEYACTNIVDLALPTFSTTASVQPPFGEKNTCMSEATTFDASSNARKISFMRVTLQVLSNCSRRQ
jgi:hypothetical protein